MMIAVIQSVADSAWAKPNRKLPLHVHAVNQQHAVQSDRERQHRPVPDRRPGRFTLEVEPLAPGDEQIEHGDGAVQYEPFGA